MKKRQVIFTPERAQEVQDEIFSKMSAEQKVKMVGQFFKLGRKLNRLCEKKDEKEDSSKGK